MKTLLKFFLFVPLLLVGCSSDDSNRNAGESVGFDSFLSFSFEGNTDTKDAIETVVRETLILVNARMSLEDINIIVSSTPASIIPEIGIGGSSPNGFDILMSVDLDFPNLANSIANEFGPLLAHEMHHAKRQRSTEGYGTTLFEACVSEGLADCFSMEVFDIDPPIWSVALAEADLEAWINSAEQTWDDDNYNHPEWFFGTSANIPRWTGYSIGYKLVKDYLVINTDQEPSDLYDEPADSFLED
ncbi:DUF2268 domain-containing putative Zn-dependent protease [Winogradskyella sp. 3972H.M.0a.05]|uniref:DUF2268 domain-containing putative Zn-dependent protease n=1 Tax=Winogradskyella sp. 3972H.M.0a.05 TaxID=2950277 RepID=UPI00339839BA